MNLLPSIFRRESPSMTWADPFRLFDELLEDGSRAPAERVWWPAADAFEGDGKLVVRLEVPGIEKGDVDVKLDGNVLTVRGQRRLDFEDKRANYHRLESSYGAFTRSFMVPETVDRDKVAAEYKDGILTVTLPLKPEAQPRAIPVRAE